MEKNKYRNELKYRCSIAQLEIIKSRISRIMPLDKHASSSGYTIRSLYFDDINNRCFYENESGIDPREKFRIRIYNGSINVISLECKRKQHDKTLKTSCKITEQQCICLMKQEVPKDIEKNQDVLRKLMILMRTTKMQPVVIVEYDRVPFVYRIGNVRVTLDCNIRSSSQIDNFLEPTIITRPILPCGEHLIEVKFDEMLPDYIYRALQMDFLQRTSFSKYYLCRKYNLGGLK